MHTGPRQPQATGFTILEMLIVVSIAAVLLILGVPAFQDFGARQRMSASLQLLQGHLALARDQAIRFNTHVIACPGGLDRGCEDNGDWSDGWIVFSDFNGDGDYQPLETVFRIVNGLEQMVVHSTSGRPKLHFFPNGSAPGSNGSITFCDRRGPEHARKLVIANSGRIRRAEAPGIDERHCPPIGG